MNFTSDIISKIIFSSLAGSLVGTVLTSWFTDKRNKRDLSVKVYERWISNPLYSHRIDVFNQLKAFFDISIPSGYKLSEQKVKLSDLKYLSKKRHNYQPLFSEDFIINFVQILTFFSDLSKLMRQNLIDVELSQTFFRNSILPWYKYLNKIEFDSIEESEYSFIYSEIILLKDMLENVSLNEVSILHIKYLLIEQEYKKLKQELKQNR